MYDFLILIQVLCHKCQELFEGFYLLAVWFWEQNNVKQWELLSQYSPSLFDKTTPPNVDEVQHSLISSSTAKTSSLSAGTHVELTFYQRWFSSVTENTSNVRFLSRLNAWCYDIQLPISNINDLFVRLTTHTTKSNLHFV